MTDWNDLSLEQLQQRMAELSAQREHLEALAAAHAATAKQAMVESIATMIDEGGYDAEEIFARVLAHRRGGRFLGRGGGVRTTWVDPENPALAYVRGPLPAWLREKMRVAGYDPADKAQREAYKREHLRPA